MTTALTLLAALGAGLALFLAHWAATRKGDDVSGVDALWGPAFAAMLAAGALVARPGAMALAVLGIPVGLWAARLAFHMNAKHRARGGEDARYRAMRDRVGDKFPRWSLTYVHLLQAGVAFVVASPIHVGLIGAGVFRADPFQPALLAGVAIFAAGFAIEVIADRQLAAFKARRGAETSVFDGGLWGWSRHPNYFGEATLWLGLGLIGFGLAGAGVWALAALVGPALLTFLLLKVSGVALLEPMMAARPGYADYQARVSAFVLWPKRATPNRAASQPESEPPLV